MTAALVIACGKTPTKPGPAPLTQVGHIPALQRVVQVFQLAGVERVVVVGGGPDYAKQEKQAAALGAVCLRVEESGAEMLDGVKRGLAYLQGKCRRVLVTPADVPLFSAETVRALLHRQDKLCVPSHNGRAGHPLLLSAKYFGPVLQYAGDGGLAGAIKAGGWPISYLNVADEGVLVNVQRQSGYHHLVTAHSLNALHPELRLYLAGEKRFFGPGPYMLLALIQETESLKTACAHTGISYSKGWKIIRELEEGLGVPVVTRHRGGKDKGGTAITPAGEALLAAYQGFQRESRAAVEGLFQKYFPTGEQGGG